MTRGVEGELVVEPVGADLVALAQCHALDASIFPHPSVPAVLAGSPPAVFVARRERGGAVVGFLGTRADEGVVEIVSLAVAREERGTGVGRALLRAAVDAAHARGSRVPVRAVTLHCSTGNRPALELYTSEGFRPAHRIRRFYDPRRFPDGGDAYVMVLRFA